MGRLAKRHLFYHYHYFGYSHFTLSLVSTLISTGNKPNSAECNSALMNAIYSHILLTHTREMKLRSRTVGNPKENDGENNSTVVKRRKLPRAHVNDPKMASAGILQLLLYIIV